jgi:hypothetical protein
MKYKWVVEFEVTELWVADGFNITQGRAIDMIANALPYASGAEFSAKVIKSSTEQAIKKAQGYGE